MHTPFADLDSLLEEFVAGVRAALADNFRAAYLQGSFALGDSDEHSDVDFIVVTEREPSAGELAALLGVHERIYASPNHWARRLEGSYAPVAILRRWALSPRDPPGEPRPDDWADPETGGRAPRVYPFWFLNNGAKTLVRSEHDNTRVVRWILREHGVALAGPSAHELVESVSSHDLGLEIAEMLQSLSGELDAKHNMKLRWQQAFVALLCGRMLHVLETGAIGSKRAAVDWAAEHLRHSWALVIERAWDLRRHFAESWQEPADAMELADTAALVRYALDVASEQRL
jgi:hypothetical protein